MSRCRIAIATLSLLLVCSWALPSANAQDPEIPQNHGIALAAGCDPTTCVGTGLSCDVDVSRNDVCGDAIQLLGAFARVSADPNNPTRVPVTGNLMIVAVSGNTTAVVGPFTAPVYIGAAGDTAFGLQGTSPSGVVTFGIDGEFVVTATDHNPLLTNFFIDWMDTCDHFNHAACPDCPAGVTFTASTGAVTTIEPKPNCCIAGPTLVCPGPHSVTYTVSECSNPPLPPSSLPVTFDWTISGDAVFCDGTNTATGDTVCVDAFFVCPGSFTLSVTVTTAFGCTNTCEFLVEINDTTPPVLTGCPPDAPFQCFAEVPPPADVTAEDNCDGPLTPIFSETQTNPDSNCNNVITRTWFVEDFCGNTASCTQIITVNDNTAPELFGCPVPTLSFQCFADVPPPANVTASDNCDGPLTPVFSENQTHPGSSCNNVITRHWTVTDTCGNSSTCSQIITVNDNTAPVLTGCPVPTLTVQCLGDVPSPANVTASDNCDGPLTPVFSETQSHPGSNCNNVIARHWTATDTCGNSASCAQVITVNDTTGPILTGCPSGQVLDCNTPFDFTVTADDNCDGPVPAVCQMTANSPAGSATFTSLGNGAYELVFTATGTATISCSATDSCGNASAPCSADFSADCAVGCTLTWGYWKTHGIPSCGNSANPHPDPTWLLLPGGLGTDTIFYLSGDTYCGVMLTAPKGNPYYSLAHQFIAVQLNVLAGASLTPQAVEDAFNAALVLFQTYTPAQVKASSTLKAQFNALVGILDDYNNGLIGPGHCDGDTPPPSVTEAPATAAPVDNTGTSQTDSTTTSQTLNAPGTCGPAGLLAPLASALGLIGLRSRRR